MEETGLAGAALQLFAKTCNLLAAQSLGCVGVELAAAADQPLQDMKGHAAYLQIAPFQGIEQER